MILSSKYDSFGVKMNTHYFNVGEAYYYRSEKNQLIPKI
jgi:hypothetical protein